jgi:hypothetical protein
MDRGAHRIIAAGGRMLIDSPVKTESELRDMPILLRMKKMMQCVEMQRSRGRR